MQYEIRSLDAVINDRTVLVEVAWWYSDAAIGNRPADFVEHLVFHDIPEPTPRPVRNEVGQLVRSDGVFADPWIEVDGEWIGWLPEPGDPDYQWIVPTDDVAARIEQFLEYKATLLLQEPQFGTDKFALRDRPKLRSGNQHVVAKQAKLRAMRNKRGHL